MENEKKIEKIASEYDGINEQIVTLENKLYGQIYSDDKVLYTMHKLKNYKMCMFCNHTLSEAKTKNIVDRVDVECKCPVCSSTLKKKVEVSEDEENSIKILEQLRSTHTNLKEEIKKLTTDGEGFNEGISSQNKIVKTLNEQITDKKYNQANEILYVLKSFSDISEESLSKIFIQKILYLAATLAPVKEVILAFVNFQKQLRGPYSKDIQNVLDHLYIMGFVELTEFEILKGKNSIAKYKINTVGINIVNRLIKYSHEEEKYWWIKCIVSLAKIYSEEKIEKNGKYTGFDKIVDLVYQDPSFKKSSNMYEMIDLKKTTGDTQIIIQYVKEYLNANEDFLKVHNERKIAELILIAFFDKYLADLIYNQQ